MATKEELSEQLALTLKLSSAVDSMARAMARVEASYDTQIASIEKLTRAIEQLKGIDLGSLNQVKLDNVQKEFKDTEKQASGLSGRIKGLADQMSKKVPVSAGAAAGAMEGFKQGIRNIIAVGKGLVGFFESFVSGSASIVASIIAIPFKMFNALVDTAAAAGGGMNELAVAIEKVRKEFGDLKGPAAGAIIETSKTLQGFADTGLSAFRVFGTLAERLEHVTKIASSMGATFGVLRKEFEDNGGALLAFEKGLDGSGEGMKQIAERAITLGKPMTKVFLDMTKQTLALGKAFDIDQKLIGKDMVKAFADVKHFGATTVKEIAQASVYARKLGIELDKIVGTLDAFETFDTAAENAAKLSQAFGVNIDAFKLMEAQNPAEQLDMLRKSFRSAGIDASQFTRQQAKLLATSTGLDDAVVRQAFSAKNYGVSLDDIKKKSETAEKKTLTQAEAMSKLADSIERMIKSGAGQTGGFWDMFVKGILGGIQSSKDFAGTIWNIKRALHSVYMIGVELGRALPKLIPDLGSFLSGMREFFDPTKFKALFGGISDAVKWFLNDKEASFKGLMDKLRASFFNFFDAEKPAAKKMLEAFKGMFTKLSKVVAQGIGWVSKNIAEGIKNITEFITNPQAYLEKAKGADGGALSFVIEALMPIAKALKNDAWPVLFPAFKGLFESVWKRVTDYLKSPEFMALVKPALPYIAAALFGPALTRALLGAVTASLGKSVVGIISGALTSNVAKKGLEKSIEFLVKSVTGPGKLAKFVRIAGPVALIAGAGASIGEGIEKYSSKITSTLDSSSKTIGAAATGFIDSLTLGLLPDDFSVKIANAIASASDVIFASLDNTFGHSFGRNVKKIIADSLSIVGDVWKLLKNLFTGDQASFDAALASLKMSLSRWVVSGFEFLGIQLPSLLNKVMVKIIAAVSSAISKLVFTSLGALASEVDSAFNTSFSKKLESAGQRVSENITNISDASIKQIELNAQRGSDVVDRWHEKLTSSVQGEAPSASALGNDEINASIQDAARDIDQVKRLNEQLTDPKFDIASVVEDVRSKLSGIDFKVIDEKQIDDLTTSTAALSKLDGTLQSLSKIRNSIMSLGDINATLNDVTLTLQALQTSAAELGSSFAETRQSFAGVEFNVMSADQSRSLNDAINGISQLNKVMSAFQETYDGFVKLPEKMSVDLISKSLQVINEFPDSVLNSVSAIKNNALIPALLAVQKMVAAVNDMNSALSDGALNKLDVVTKLKSVANSVGLGSKATYEIKNKDVVINLNLSVSMNVDEVEKVMILRKNSIVRDRINLSLDADKTTAPAHLPETPGSPVPVPFTRQAE